MNPLLGSAAPLAAEVLAPAVMSPSDPLSHDELLAQHRFVGALARRLVADAGRVDDVAQETYVYLLGARRRPDSLRGWLRAVVRNVVRQLARGEGRRSAREEVVAARAQTVAPATDEIADQLELQRRLIDRVLALPPLYKDVVLLHFYEERTVAQTAARLQIPLETARTRLRRALEELRAGFDVAQGGDHAGLFGLLQLARLVPVSTATAVSTVSLGAWIAMAKTSKLALTAAAIALVGGGWWLWNERGDSRHVVRPTDPVPLAAAASATAPPPVTAERSAEAGSIEKAPSPASAVAGDFGSVRVHVTSAKDKTPLANLPVRLISEEHAPSFVDEVQGTTDGNGDFFAPRVPIGSVIANAAGFMWWTGSSAKPKLAERECTRRIVVRAGETTEVALSVYREVEVDGRVVDPTGAAVADATIWVADITGYPITGEEFGRTDALGRFHIPVLEHGHLVSAFARGFAPAPAINLPRSERGARVDVVLQLLEAGGQLHGRVVDTLGRPVERAFVYACGPWRGGRQLHDGTIGEQPPGRLARTKSDGTFDVESAPLGDIHLVVRARNFAFASERFRLAADETKEVDLTMRMGGTLKGTLLTHEGKPLCEIAVRVAPPATDVTETSGDLLASIVRSDEAGRFVLQHLGAGPLEATIDGGEEGTASLSFSVADGETREWSVALSRGSEILGVVVDEAGTPCVGWTIVARMEKYEPGIQAPPEVKMDAEGRFALSRCSDRSYELMVREPAPDPRQRAFFSDVVLHGVRPSDVELRVEVPTAAHASAFIVGRVIDSDGLPIPSPTLYCSQLDGTDNVGENVGGAAGFRLGPFPPGDYMLRLMAETLPDLPLGKRTLTAGQSLDLGTITMPRPGFAEVHVTHADGTPVQDGDIDIWSDTDGEEMSVGRIGDGFRSVALAPGHYVLTGGWGKASAWIPFDVVASQTAKLSITVEPGAIRSFHLVTSSGGLPVAPVQVTASIRDGRELWSRAWPELRGGSYVVSQRFAVGRFTIAFKAADGCAGAASFEVADLTDTKTPIDVTLR